MNVSMKILFPCLFYFSCPAVLAVKSRVEPQNWTSNNRDTKSKKDTKNSILHGPKPECKHLMKSTVRIYTVSSLKD